MFDRTISGLIDSAVYILDHNPPWYVRIVLRWYKRVLESSIR